MKNKKEYTNFVFDLYGTLIDIHTEEEMQVLWEKLALFYGYYDAHYTAEELKQRFRELIRIREAGKKEQLLAKDSHEAFPEIQLEEVFEALYREKGVIPEVGLSVHTGQFFRVMSTEYIRLYEGVIEMLEALRKAGKKVYLLSNAQRIFTEYELHAFDIAKYFDAIFISSDYQVKKPDIRFFQALIEEEGLHPSETIMLGNDAISDIKGAKQAGFDTCYVHSNLSPELPVIRKVKTDGTILEELQMPDADYVMEEPDWKKGCGLFGIGANHETK